jgi:hypothetical protein
VFDPLFGPDPIGQAFDLQRKKALDCIAEQPAYELRTANLDELVANLVTPYLMAPLVLRWKDKAAFPDNERIEVDHDASGRPLPVSLMGEFIFVVPYDGMAGLFRLRPTRCIGKPPSGCVWESQKLLKYSVARADLATVRRALQQAEAAIKRWAAWVNQDVSTFNAELQRSMREELAARLDEIRAGDDILAALDVPQATLELRQTPRDPPRHPGLAKGSRVRDEMEALEADQAIERLVSPHPPTFSSGPMSHERRAQAMTTALGASAREALAQLIDADAANGEGYFVIVRPNGASPLVAKGQFRAPIGGRDLIELERAGVLLPNSRNADGLKTFYLSPDSRRLLDAALAAAGEPTPLKETSTSEPGPAPITTRDEGEAKNSHRDGAARGPGRPGWTAELFRTRYAEAERRAKPPYTYAAVAPYFEMLDGTRGTDPEYFRKLVRRYRETPE